MALRSDRVARSAERARRAISNAAPNVLNTKGDLVVHDGNGYARLPVGANGKLLKADSTQTLGVAWGSSALALYEEFGTLAAGDDIGISSTAQNNFTKSSGTLIGFTFSANQLVAGTTWRLTVAGTRDLGAIGHPRLRCYFGNQVAAALLFDTDDNQSTITTATGSNLPWNAECEFRVLTTGAAGTVRGNAWGDVLSAINSSQNCFRSSKLATVDTTIAEQLTLTWTWSVSNAGNKSRMMQYTLEQLS